MAFSSPFPLPAVPRNLSVSQFLVQTNPDDVPHDKVIISDFDTPRHVLTYGGLRGRSAQGAATLRGRFGMKEGDVVCLLGYNSVNWMLLCHCILWGGGALCGINPLSTSHELIHYFGIAKPAIIAVDAALLPRVYQALSKLPLPSVQVVIIEDGHHDGLKETRFPRDFIRFQCPSAAPYNLTNRDNKTAMAAMCFSSGTSGLPKGVMLSHHTLIAQLLCSRATSPFLNNAHVKEVFYPLFGHIYGLVSCVLMTAWVGHHAVTMKQFDFLPYLQRCAAIEATVLRLVPSTAARMAKDPVVLRLDLTSVRNVMVAGAALSPETIRVLQTDILHPDAAVLNGYGMTECTISTLRETRGQTHPGSLGRVAAGMEIRIVDDQMRNVPVGESGQCLVRGPTLFMGYQRTENEKKESFTEDGWFITGDIVKIDDNGFLWMTGRKKELIKFRGNQIAPAELEAVLMLHPLVIDAGVCGIYSKEMSTEVPVGAVTLSSSVPVSEYTESLAEIMAFLNEKLSPYKRLRGGLYHLENIPKGVTGKLQRRDIPAAIEAAKLKSKL